MRGRKGVKNVRTEEFIEKWDRIARSTRVDPVRILFKIAGGKMPKKQRWTEQEQLKALTTLMAYRYPKLRSIEARIADEDRELIFRWLGDGDSDPV